MGLKKKAFYTVTFWFVFLIGYFFIQHTATLSDLTLLSELDKAIPFMPEFIWVYHSLPLYIFLVMVLSIQRAGVFWRTLYSCIIATILVFSFYIILPVEYPRPAVHPAGISTMFLSVTQKIDMSMNTCPSSHVAFAWLMFLAAAQTQWVSRRPLFAGTSLLWAIGISLSTLTLKQHFIIDVVAGIAVACVSFYLAKYFLNKAPAPS
jgi:membrane-associated phospholipid phosphatase